MKRRLNPELVIQSWGGPPAERWISLRDPKHPDLGQEERIGRMEMEVLLESKEDSVAFRQRLRGTESGLSDLYRVFAGHNPSVVLTEDCFGCKGTVGALAGRWQPG